MEEENDEKENFNEPEILYTPTTKKRITFFNSFDEAQEFTRKQRLSMSPEERIASVTSMLKLFYKDELSQGKKYHRITFGK
ncbi:MAG: hypothetical protein LH473_00395 [Chitinophagales bacterium]|nr:hypothetical protein [Chitinophagales bacterium]